MSKKIRVTTNKKLSKEQLQKQIDNLLLLYKHGKLEQWMDY